MNLVAVKFKSDGKSYYFDSNELELEKNEYVLVETEKGVQLRIVSDINIDNEKLNLNKELKKVIKKASKSDYDLYLKNVKDAEIVLLETRKKIEKEQVPMRLVDAMYTFDKKQLILNFVADERIDFRQLARDLGSMFRTRIELRQIGIRDKAREIGGIGPCGRLLCCTSFLKSFDSVTINMAKNQNVSLNPSKINGVCGRLLCCLKYENDIYFEMKKELPKIGDKVDIPQGSGKVISVNLFKGSYIVELDDKSRVEVVGKSASQD